MTAKAGFTILEFTIGMTILSIGLLAVAGVVGRTGSAYESSTRHVLYEAELGRAMNRIVEALSGTTSTIIQPDPTGELGTSDLRYRIPTDMTATTITWGPQNRLVLDYEPTELDNGADDDGDGLVDEMELALILDENGPGERRRVLCGGLSELSAAEQADGDDNDGNQLADEPGFCIRRMGDVLVIHLAGQASVPGEEPIEVALSTRLALRN